MKRRLMSRVLLAVLLVWQVEAATIVHAMPVAPTITTGTASHGSHCAHKEPTGHAPASGQATSATHVSHHGTPSERDCCAHSACVCACAGLAAVPFEDSYSLPVVPDHPAVKTFVAPRIEARAFEFFRPPI